MDGKDGDDIMNSGVTASTLSLHLHPLYPPVHVDTFRTSERNDKDVPNRGLESNLKFIAAGAPPAVDRILDFTLVMESRHTHCPTYYPFL